MRENRKIVVLLSTYNAQRYLAEQLDSLLEQTCRPWRILVRDDGSSDETGSILKTYAAREEVLSYYTGENLGAKDSFFDLLKKVADWEFDYCAFCDQDDYWKPEKLERAVTQMEQAGSGALLYCGRTCLVDASLKPLQEQIRRSVSPAFGNALVENVVTGCTTVLNRELVDIMQQFIPQYCIMHDWWMYLVASCFGRVLYDDTPYILYRQHGGNVMGLESRYRSEFKSRLQKFKSRRGNISRQAQEFVRLSQRNSVLNKLDNDMECLQQRLQTAALVANYKKSLRDRLTLVFGKRIFRQRHMDDFIFRILFLLGLR